MLLFIKEANKAEPSMKMNIKKAMNALKNLDNHKDQFLLANILDWDFSTLHDG